MKTLNIEVEGMKCGGCVVKVTNHFNASDKISSVEVDLENKLVKIVGEDDLSNMSVRNEIIELGFNVTSIKKA